LSYAPVYQTATGADAILPAIIVVAFAKVARMGAATHDSPLQDGVSVVHQVMQRPNPEAVCQHERLRLVPRWTPRRYLYFTSATAAAGRRAFPAGGSALFMMYVERNDGHDTPQSYVRRNLTRPQSLLQFKKITSRFFEVSSTEADVMFYSRCNFPDGAGGLIHCIFISYPKSEKRPWDNVVTRMSLALRVRR
jgi:hypothetical protein